jgi:hypothetical protein
MPPLEWSRYSYCWGLKDASGRIGLSERERFLYRDLEDNRIHSVAVGDSLFNLAERAFPSFPRACGLFWVIADFQPSGPILDATIALEVGSTIVIPSERTVRELVFDEARRSEFSG